MSPGQLTTPPAPLEGPGLGFVLLTEPDAEAEDRRVEGLIEDTMAKTDYKSVDEYIAAHPEPVRAILQRVRRTIRKALPGAEEVISYQIPAYRLGGARVLYFAGWKQHYSLYPANDRLVAEFEDDLARYEVSKGTIRFPLSQPIPERLIERIAKFRAGQAAERAATKPAGRKGR